MFPEYDVIVVGAGHAGCEAAAAAATAVLAWAVAVGSFRISPLTDRCFSLGTEMLMMGTSL